MFGEVVGINTMYLEGGENLNFAIPVNDAKRLLLNQSATLRSLPNEVEESPKHAEVPKPVIPDKPKELGGSPVNSPAYRSYQELLTSGDMTFKVSTYACFSDDPQSKQFKVINATLLSKQTMTVVVQDFTNGVSDIVGIFEGPLSPYSGQAGLFATLPTQFNNPISSHKTDALEWGLDELEIKTGFGKLAGEVRSTYEFKMQRSTGRYTVQIRVVLIGEAPIESGETGKCIRIPGTQTPEEIYRSLGSVSPPSAPVASHSAAFVPASPFLCGRGLDKSVVRMTKDNQSEWEPIIDCWLVVYAPENFDQSQHNADEMVRYMLLHYNGDISVKHLSEAVKTLGDRIEYSKVR